MYYNIAKDNILFLQKTFKDVYSYIVPRIYKTKSDSGYRINLSDESEADEVYDRLTFALSACITDDLNDVTPDGERIEHIIDSL